MFENFHPKRENKINHIGIIPDGGRRYARENGISYDKSYNISMDKIEEFIVYLFENKMCMVSIYFSSKQNFIRSIDEVKSFENAETKFLRDNLQRIKKRFKSINVNILGDLSYVCPEFRSLSHSLMSDNIPKAIYNINICAAYDSFDEIKNIIKEYSDEKTILDAMWCNVPIDLILRTGGACLLSNFMLLQSGFARIKCIDKLFNDLSLQEFKLLLQEFCSQNRKYGE